MPNNIFSRIIPMLFLMLIMSGSFLLIPSTAQATALIPYEGIVPCGRYSDDTNTTDIDETDKCTICHLAYGMHTIINIIVRIAALTAVVGLMVAGIIYAVSAGNSGATGKAKEAAKKILIGLFIILVAWVIVNEIFQALDIAFGWDSYSCTVVSTSP
jgi:hypothetical protein